MNLAFRLGFPRCRMQAVRSCSRFLLLVTLTLPAVGCRGCQVNPTAPDSREVDAAIREAIGEIYVKAGGPRVVASAVGAAAPPGGLGGLSALSMEIAFREYVERELSRDRDVGSAASFVGVAAASDGSGLLSVLVAMVAQAHRSDFSGKSWRLPSMFEAQDPKQQ